MITSFMTRIVSVDGVEIWKLTSRAGDQFGVRLDARRARLVSSLASAEAVLARHVRLGRLARAH